MASTECIFKWANGENLSHLPPDWGDGRHFSKVTCYKLEPREVLPIEEAFLAGLPHIGTVGTRRIPGHFIINQGVRFLCKISHWICNCRLASSHHQGCFCVSVNEVSLLQEQPHIDTPRPTPGSDCWLDCGLFPPTIQFEAAGIVRQPLRHPRLSRLRVTVQTEENDSFYHFLLNDSMLIQPVPTPSNAVKKKGEERIRPRIESTCLSAILKRCYGWALALPSLRKSLFSSTRAYSCAGEKPPVSFLYLFPHQDLFLGKNPLFLMHQQWGLCVRVRIIRPEMSGSVTGRSHDLG